MLTAPRSPWQNPFVERLVGSIRRECLDHVIVWNERSLRRTLRTILPTISDPVRIYPWAKTPPRPGQWNRGTGVRGSDSSGRGITPPISATRRLAGASRFLDGCLPERKCRFSLINATKLLLIKPDSLATRTPCTWMHSTTGRGRDCQSLDSDVLARIDTDGVVGRHRDHGNGDIIRSPIRAMVLPDSEVSQEPRKHSGENCPSLLGPKDH